jgi:hypothetical protein
MGEMEEDGKIKAAPKEGQPHGRPVAAGVATAALLVLAFAVGTCMVAMGRDSNLKREKRDLELIVETAELIKQAVTDDYTIREDIEDLGGVDVTLESILDGTAPCKALDGYLSSSLGMAADHGYELSSYVARDASVYVRIKGTRVEVLAAETQGGTAVQCDFLKTGDTPRQLKTVK